MWGSTNRPSLFFSKLNNKKRLAKVHHQNERLIHLLNVVRLASGNCNAEKEGGVRARTSGRNKNTTHAKGANMNLPHMGYVVGTPTRRGIEIVIPSKRMLHNKQQRHLRK
jgi:hypothetical protein